MKRYLILLALLLPLIGCDLDTGDTITAPEPLPPGAGAVASATCNQNGAALSIVCRDSSRDPQSQVPDGGVRFTAALSGSGFQAIEFGTIDQQTLIDVTGGGPGTYLVTQELMDDQGRVIASNSYSVPVI